MLRSTLSIRPEVQINPFMYSTIDTIEKADFSSNTLNDKELLQEDVHMPGNNGHRNILPSFSKKYEI